MMPDVSPNRSFRSAGRETGKLVVYTVNGNDWVDVGGRIEYAGPHKEPQSTEPVRREGAGVWVNHTYIPTNS